MTHKLKCRYCDYTVSAWYTSKNGKHHDGMYRLFDHIEDEHPAEAQATRDRLVAYPEEPETGMRFELNGKIV